MKRIFLILLGIGLAPAAFAGEVTISGNASVRSDYIFRGVSQSDEGVAVQAGVDAVMHNRVYGGAWLSTVDKPWGAVYNRVGGEEDIEFDIWLGRKFQISGGEHPVTGDAGLIHYGFASDPDGLSWSEAYVGLEYRGLSARFATDIQGAPMGDYMEANYQNSFRELFNYRLHVGHYRLNRNIRGFEKYTDFSAGVSKQVKGVDLSLTYHRNDRNGEKRFLRLGDDRIVFSVDFARPLMKIDY